MTKIERAARAMADKLKAEEGAYIGVEVDGRLTFDGSIDLQGVVHAVIAAIREPSEGMVSDGAFQIFQGERITEQDLAAARRVWRAMTSRLVKDIT